MKKLFKGLKFITFFIIGLVLIILIPIGISKLFESARSSFLSEKDKRMEDVERLEYLMKTEFAGYNVLERNNEFFQEISALKKSIEEEDLITDEDFGLGVIRVVSSFNDPHTLVYNKEIFLKESFPYSLRWSNGNFYLLAAQVDPKWLGAKVLKFENTDPEIVFRKLSAYTNAPNEAGTAYFLGSFLRSNDVLFREGIITDKSKITLEVMLKNGDTEKLKFNSIPDQQRRSLPDYTTLSEKYPDDPTPLYKSNYEQNYWYEFLEESSLFYLRYSYCVDQGDADSFWEEVFEKIHELSPEKLVIDVRNNPGGDTQTHSSLLYRIQQDTIINKYGKLFTFINRGTGSAAVNFASEMEKTTNCILVGEKTIDNPSTTSDPTFFSLPHSEITILIPSIYNSNTHAYDRRNGIGPQISIHQSFDGNSYLKDRVLDSIQSLTFETPELSHARLPDLFEGQYSFSEIRNVSISKKDSIWYLSLDGLLESRLYQKDSSIYTQQFGIELVSEDSSGNNIVLNIHGSKVNLNKIASNELSLISAIENRDFERTTMILESISKDGELPYYLDRPFFQSKIYPMYLENGFETAYSFNKITKQYYPNDPVVSIVDFELYRREGNVFGQIKSVFPIIGKLGKRYIEVITTDKVMNDDYNGFIGR